MDAPKDLECPSVVGIPVGAAAPNGRRCATRWIQAAEVRSLLGAPGLAKKVGGLWGAALSEP